MNKKEQKEFVNNLIDSVKKDILENIENGKIPESWDGVELREIIKDNFSQVVWKDTPMSNKRSKRYKDYKELIVNL